MASPNCSVDGCRKTATKRGMCNAHYLRWWKKGTTDGRALNGEPLKYLHAHMWDDCPKWPFAKNADGRGLVRYDGSARFAHQISCLIAHGPKPSDKHEVAHNCGKGHLGCFGARCVEWKTPSENNQDKLLHGTSNRGRAQHNVKLTEHKVREIRRLQGWQRPIVIAKKFGISPTTVHDIWNRKSWFWLS